MVWSYCAGDCTSNLDKPDVWTSPTSRSCRRFSSCVSVGEPSSVNRLRSGNEAVMTIEQGGAEADVKIRVPRTWVGYTQFVIGGVWLVIAAAYGLRGLPWVALLGLVGGCLYLWVGLAMRIFGVDLTHDFAVVRGLRKRKVRWAEVQAVVSDDGKYGTSVVRLILDSGESVRLPFPSSYWRKGNAQCERDFHRIDQWWIAHRGGSWRPVLPKAPEPSP